MVKKLQTMSTVMGQSCFLAFILVAVHLNEHVLAGIVTDE